MDEHQKSKAPADGEARVKGMHLTDASSLHEASRNEGLKVETNGAHMSPGTTCTSPSDSSPIKSEKLSPSPQMMKDGHPDVVGGEMTVKMEPAHPPKLARTASQKASARPPALFDSYPDKTEESKGTFQVIGACIYSSKQIGSTEQAMECDCAEEWDSSRKANWACGDDSDCINRATKMECVDDCGCGSNCQNQRFQQQQYANVAVIKTEKKGYGLRAESDLRANDFIFEYIGEVINEAQFRRRMIQYDEEGIKHFYFMSLSKGEFVDATKKGNLGRFCNHSCNPNCYVDKWVVGDKLRMGIFAERNIQAGEELVFNYNVDRYGADPQPCYCAEPNCTGYIGGKTQTERATKLSNTTIEALGIDDGDGWDTAVAKKPRKKKIGEDDEEYVNHVQPKSLDEDGVTKVMATLLQCKEKWIAVKLLSRIQRCDDERVRNRVVKMHGYQILNSALALWKEDFNVVLQILDILNQFPRLTRNKISDSKIESTVESLKGCGDDRVESQAMALLKEWSTLEVAYRIPRKKRDVNRPATSATPDHFGRRESGRDERKGRSRSRSVTKSRSRSRSLDAPRGPAAPTGPRAGPGQRHSSFYTGPRPPYRPRPFNSLPPGWFAATSNGSTYYYSAAGTTTWIRPTYPAPQPPPPPKPGSANKALEDIINEITNAKAKNTVDPVARSTTPPLLTGDLKKQTKNDAEKWRTYSEDKQKKIYENTLFPHIRYVMNKFKAKLPRDDLKRFAKEISKKLVNSDFKNNRVEDPRHISSRQEKQVKKYVKEYFDKAVVKKQVYEKKKAERQDKAVNTPDSHQLMVDVEVQKEHESDEDLDIGLSDDEGDRMKQDSGTPITPLDQPMNGDVLKRKRECTEAPGSDKTEDESATPSKRLRSETPPPPPPPPPPPAECESINQETSLDQPMTDDNPESNHPKLTRTATNQNETNLDMMTDIARTEVSPVSEVDPTPELAFKITRPYMDLAETSDSARSSTIFEAPNLTPIESDGDAAEKAEQSYAGLNLVGVRELEVHDS